MDTHDKSDKDLLDRIKTREELEKRGYERRTCTSCKGAGVSGDDACMCWACDGRGYRWQSPLMC